MFEPLFLLLFFFVVVVVVVVFVIQFFSSIIFYFFIPSSFDSQSSVLYIVLYDSTLPYGPVPAPVPIYYNKEKKYKKTSFNFIPCVLLLIRSDGVYYNNNIIRG